LTASDFISLISLCISLQTKRLTAKKHKLTSSRTSCHVVSQSL